jgi:hypothetical protein
MYSIQRIRDQAQWCFRVFLAEVLLRLDLRLDFPLRRPPAAWTVPPAAVDGPSSGGDDTERRHTTPES